MFVERLLRGDEKGTFNHAALGIGICTADNFNKALLKMTKHAFLVNTFCKQKRDLDRHIIKHKNMKLFSFISRLQKLNAYLEEIPSDSNCISSNRRNYAHHLSFHVQQVEKQDD